MKIIDLRSDTVTKPTEEMRKAMYQAEVGDDGYQEDPTVTKLEELAAQLTGKEAGLFVTSGTQGNQVAIMSQAKKSDEIICEANAHIFSSETGGIAALTGAQIYPISANQGKLTPELINPAIRKVKMNAPRTTLITLENTHNHAGGTYYTPAELAAIRNLADQHNLAIHIDGARIFNAAVAQKLPINQLTQYADSVQICLSKGLCAPIGSMVVGTKNFIDQARRCRRLLGGGMRQVGIIAAAGIVALDTMVERLEEDHIHARLLAENLANCNFGIDLAKIQTNILMLDTKMISKTAAEVIASLKQHHILANEFGPHTVRMVTHYGITREDIDFVSNTFLKLTKN